MAQVLPELTDRLIDWIGEQPMFFVASAPSGDSGNVNLSPKGYDTIRVLSPTRLAYLDLTGSGAETIAHVRQNGRITVMWCGFSGPPRIVRVAGRGEVVQRGEASFDELAALFPGQSGARSVIVVTADRISSSCGYAVPFMDLVGERPKLAEWADARGEDGIVEYWAANNTTSIDGLPAVAVPPSS